MKLHKPFFIGRRHAVTAYRDRSREVLRFAVSEPGARPVHAAAAVVDRRGDVLGRVTSCVSLGETQIGMALVERGGIEEGTPVTILAPPRRDEAAKASSDLAYGDRVAVPVSAVVLPRFPAAGMSPASA